MALPAYLQAPDLAGDYARGISLGQAAAGERQRLSLEAARISQQTQAEQQQLEQSAAARAEQIKRETLQENARLQTQKAYHDAEIGLAQQRLQQQQQQASERSRMAALKMADQHGFASDVAAGSSIEQALYRHPNANPASAIAAHKDTLDLASQRLDVAKENLNARQREIEARQNRTVRVGEDVVEDQDNPGTKHTTYRFGVPGAMPVPAANTNRIPVTSPTGKRGTVPPGHLDAALEAGYKRTDQPTSATAAENNNPADNP